MYSTNSPTTTNASSTKHNRGNSVDALTNSVDIRNKMINIVGNTKNQRDNSVRVSKFNGRDDLVHHSVHDYDKNKNNELEQLSVNGH
jgi:hypothetical protein